MTFQQDIASKHLNVYPVVMIQYHNDTYDYLSTRKGNIAVSEVGGGEIYFKPILLNIPAISESIDIETKKYRISSVTLNISDYEYDGKRFSDSLTDLAGNSIINAEIYIYYVSQSMETFADFQLVGHYIVRKFTQNDKQVNLICEDRSQAELHKDLPLESVADTDDIIEKYRTKPKTMVFGKVE